MKIFWKVISIITLLLILLLEFLPYGAVLNFANAPDAGGGFLQQTYSYFDLTPFGYANFGPFLTAILTSVLLLFSIMLLFLKTKGLQKASFFISILACLVSLTPLLFGIEYYSLIGLMISFLLAILSAVQWYLAYKADD